MTNDFTRDVLVVDDDDSIRSLVRAVLTRAGLACDTASDGVDAVEQLKSRRYAVVVIDLMMPRLDGAGVIETLRTFDLQSQERPIVLVFTASTDDHRLNEMGEMVQAVIRKPFDVSELGEIVHECVAARQSAQA